MNTKFQFTEILFWKDSDGVMGIAPPTRPNRLSSDCWTDSVKLSFSIKTWSLTRYKSN